MRASQINYRTLLLDNHTGPQTWVTRCEEVGMVVQTSTAGEIGLEPLVWVTSVHHGG